MKIRSLGNEIGNTSAACEAQIKFSVALEVRVFTTELLTIADIWDERGGDAFLSRQRLTSCLDSHFEGCSRLNCAQLHQKKGDYRVIINQVKQSTIKEPVSIYMLTNTYTAFWGTESRVLTVTTIKEHISESDVTD